MRHHFLTALLCVPAALIGYGIRPPSEPVEAPEPVPARRAPTTLTEILAGRRPASPSARWEATLDLVKNPPDPSEWPHLLERARTDVFAAGQIVRAWVRDDPATCWEHLVGLGEDGFPPEDLAKDAALAWAKIDPAAALEAINALPVSAVPNTPGNLRGELRWAVLRAALAEDMEGAFPLVATTLDGHGIAYGTSDTWVEQDPAKACRLLAALPNTAFRRAIAQAARTWFQRDPVAALEWAIDLPVGIQGETFNYIARDLKESEDIETLQALALATSSMRVRSRVTGPLMDIWVEKDPEAALDWIGQNSDGFIARSEAKNAMKKLLRSDRDNPDFASLTALADRLPAGSMRGGAIYAILQQWLRDAPEAAIAYAESLDPATRSSAYRDLPFSWAQHPSATEWLKTAPDLPIAHSLLRQVISKAETDALEALVPDLPPARAATVREALAARISE